MSDMSDTTVFLKPGEHRIYTRRKPRIAIVMGGGRHELPILTAKAMIAAVLKQEVPRGHRAGVPGPVAELLEPIAALPGIRRIVAHRAGRGKRPSSPGGRQTAALSSKASKASKASKRFGDGKTDSDSDGDGTGAALINATEIVQVLLQDGAFDYIWDRIFGPMLRIADRAQSNPQLARFAAPMRDHAAAVRKMRATVGEALPKIMNDLQEKNPDAPAGALLAHAMQGIYEQIARYLNVLQLYTTAIDQYSGGEDAPMLAVLNAYMQSTFVLSVTGDLDSLAAGKAVTQLVPTVNLKVGDVILTGLIGERGGLSTIPATMGPVDCHLLLVPPDMKKCIVAFLALLTHELSHQFTEDVKGFKKEQRQIIVRAIKKALAGGLKLSTPEYLIGKARVDAGQLMVKLFTDWAEETTADLRALLGHGTAFALSALFDFPAFNPQPVREQEQLLHTSGRFSLRKMRDGAAAIEIEGHPNEFLRVYGLAGDTLDLCGLSQSGNYVRVQAAKAIGGLPEFFTLELDDEDEDLVIRLSAADVLAVSKVVTDAIINTKMESLNNGTCKSCDLSLRDIVSWDEKRESKALAIAAALARGESTIPAGIGTIFRPYVVSGAIWYLWNAAMKGSLSRDFMETLRANTFAMMMQCRA
jgi:hypothetical protein